VTDGTIRLNYVGPIYFCFDPDWSTKEAYLPLVVGPVCTIVGRDADFFFLLHVQNEVKGPI
jgi:hypothetical protein